MRPRGVVSAVCRCRTLAFRLCAADSTTAYEFIVDTDENDRRLELLHTNVRKYGTISNMVAAATVLNGRIVRKSDL